MTLWGWTINWDALMARIVYRWSRPIVLGTLVVALLGMYASGAIPPVWRGRSSLVVTAPRGATVRLDGRLWPQAVVEGNGRLGPQTVYAGRHIVSATLPDGRASWTELDATAGVTTTVTLPPGLGPVRVRQLPPAAPGTAVTRVSFVGGAWRIQSSALAVAAPDAPGEHILQGAQTVALTPAGLEPLATIDAFGGNADVLETTRGALEAVVRTDSSGRAPTLGIRGWDQAETTVPLTDPVSLLRFAPDGRSLLVSEQVSALGERVSVIVPGQAPQPLVAVPGRVRDVVWDHGSRGVVVASEQGGRRSLTLARIKPSVAARVISLQQVADYDSTAASPPGSAQSPFVVLPLAWSDEGVEWIARDERGASSLWRAPLATLIAERVHPIDALAFTRTDDGALRLATVLDGRLVLARMTGSLLVVEAAIEDVPPSPSLVGQWSPDGTTLLLQDLHGAWIVDLPSGGDGTWQKQQGNAILCAGSAGSAGPTSPRRRRARSSREVECG